MPASHGGISDGYRNIKRLHALAWWVTNLTLRGKIINLNNFKTDIIADAIEESRIDFEDTRGMKGDQRNPKDFSH